MSRIISCLCLVLLAGCAGIKPMQPADVDLLKKTKVAVAFFDGPERINYLEDQYLVLGVAQLASDSTYKGFWDGSKELSSVHAEELRKIGVNAESIYNIFPQDVTQNFRDMQQEVYELDSMKSKKMTAGQKSRKQEIKKNPSIVLKPELRDRLISQGYDELFWITWDGFTLHMQTLGLPTIGKFNTTYRIFDLKQGKQVWTGTIPVYEKMEALGERTGKEFLEQNGLAGLKAQADRLARERYQVRKGRGIYNSSVGQEMGLEPKTSGRKKNERT